mmetsp:Transcript_2353/g.4405  ORF Transcript_2353/g.4405 Transcript_2353/m.4405 type:complete len:581 (-) Transcript_2353:30-1772(-)
MVMSIMVQQQNLLSKKDLKALKSQLCDQYPGIEEQNIDQLLPEGQVKVLKLDNRCLLYVASDAPPCFFDAEGRGELYPTLTTLWQHPNMMMELTIHPQVSKFVLNGADLMLPGVLVPANGVAGFGSVEKGQRRCIKIDGNPYPIAVGHMTVNQRQMEKLTGKGLGVAHVYKDALWAFAGSPLPNTGFREKDDEVTPCADQSWVVGAPAPEPPAAEPSVAPAAADGASLAAGGASPASASDASPTAVGGSKAAEDWSPDDLLEFCFMQAFHVSLTEDGGLPVEASELYEKHMKPNRPEGTTLDVKKTSHKQMGKFLNAMRKAKAIETSEKKGVISVTKVDRGHRVFKQLQDKFAADVAVEAAAAASSEAAAAVAAEPLPPPRISALWKPTHYLEGIWKEMGKSKNEVYSWDAAQQVLKAYVGREGLGSVDGSGPVRLSEALLTALFKVAGAQKKDQTWPETADFGELEEKMMDRMQEHTVIDVAGLGSTMRKGPALKIEVSLSRKGAHNVTRVCNLEAYGIDVAALGDELKRKLNCTVHVEDMPGKNTKDKMLQLQGHVDQELASFLQQKYGITRAFMSVK